MKHITKDDPLLVKQEVKFIDHKPESSETKPAAQSVITPKSNNKFLWMRPALARYNMISDSAKQKKFWRNKISPPVKLSSSLPKEVQKAISNRIFHTGYFSNTVSIDTILLGRKRSKIIYNVFLDEATRIASVTYPDTHSAIGSEISNKKPQSTLKEGDLYSLSKIKNERVRIDNELKEVGYVNFNPDFIILEGDTVSREKKIQMKVELKENTPPESLIPYFIEDVFIFSDYTLEDYQPDTTQIGDIYLISQKDNIKYKAIENGLFLRPGELYSRTNYSQTVRYLSNLPIFRYANIRFLPGTSEDQLRTLIYLTQRKRFSYSAEFNTIFRSTNYFGPGVIFSFTDRNANKGSEQFKVNLRGRFEVQVQDGVLNPAYELGIEGIYLIPRIYPKFLRGFRKFLLPRTNIAVGYNLFNRLDLYRLNSIFADFGYTWNRDDTKRHSFNPIELIFTQVPEDSKSDEFRKYLEDNPGVRRSFDDQFVFGAGYSFTYNPASKSKSSFFFNGGVDASGNLLYGISRATNGTQDPEGRYTILGLPFSQYTRFRTDFRYGYNINRKSSLATRFIAGLGVPYLNSTILPYVKQFYVGGTNSLRSFIARSVGPGSEVPPEGFNDLTGDIRLEANLEYRFTISGNFKGALFVDAGNIWLYNFDDSRPDGNFDFNRFYKEIAISTGWGLRWDFDVLVARLDFGYTLKTPYLPEGERWIKSFNFFRPVWNIAIGYPF